MRRKNKEKKVKVCVLFTPTQIEMIDETNGKLGSNTSERVKAMVLLALNNNLKDGFKV